MGGPCRADLARPYLPHMLTVPRKTCAAPSFLSAVLQRQTANPDYFLYIHLSVVPSWDCSDMILLPFTLNSVSAPSTIMVTVLPS